jgi:hypothetical protein
MALYLEANYCKKLGLPGYSSHQYSLSVKAELNELTQVQAQSARLYDLLQSCVDQEIQKTGFLPGHNGNGNAQHVGAAHVQSNGNGNGDAPGDWACSQKQKALILKIVEENNLDKNQVELLAQNRFGQSVRALSKPQASELIDELHLLSGGNNAATKRGLSGARITPDTTR